jgi:transcription-repair coupling factor (superfamily II helicase)
MVTVASRQAQRLQELWKKIENRLLRSIYTSIESASISEGFKFLGDDKKYSYFFTDSEIFGWERPLPRKSQKQVVETPEKYFSDFVPGEFVVHVDYGIGQYTGLVSRTIDGW